MYEELFSERLAKLRFQKGVSAREMSLSIGQNSSYINRIENRKALPSMQGFFYICEYLGITPEEFFAFDNLDPLELQKTITGLRRLSSEQVRNLNSIISDLIKANQK